MKYLGLLTIIPLFTIAISSYYIGTAEAESLKGEPFVEIVSVKRFSAESPDISKVTIKAYAGSLDIIDVQILVTSSTARETASINEIQALSFSITSVLLKVKDPNSVTAEILNYQIKE